MSANRSTKTRKWVYLLGEIGYPLTSYPFRESSIMPGSLPSLGISIRHVVLRFPGDPRCVEHISNSNRRFLFEIEGGIVDDELARRFAEALAATLTLVYGPLTDEVPPVLRLPASAIRGNTLTFRKLVESGVALLNIDSLSPNFLRIQLGRCLQVPDSILAQVFRLLPITLKEPYFSAVHHYVASVERYSFLGDDIGEVLADDTMRPVPQKYAVRAQDAVESAYKTIEALIGEPPKDDNKLRLKIMQIGLNPDDESTWWPGRPDESILTKVRTLHSNRDKRAAHAGSSGKKPFTYLEIMDSQGLVRVMLLAAIERELCEREPTP